MDSTKVYLPGLNGIRAIAALTVVICHFQDMFAIPEGMSFFLFKESAPAGLAVTLFFVLSGYLITYLLLLEKEKFTTVNLKAFYLRRIYRIWPLYYLIIILSAAVLYFFYGYNLFAASNEYYKIMLFYIFFAGNVAMVLYNVSFIFVFGPISILWSVAVEEQFYLFWPVLVRFFKKPVNVFIGFLIVYNGIKIMLRAFFPHSLLSPFIYLTRLDCMAIGAIGACLVLDKKLYAKIVVPYIFKAYVQLLAWAALIIGFTLVLTPLSIFSEEAYAVFFTILIINVSQNEKTLVNLENKVLNFLGRISYGLYMYHAVIMYTLVVILPKPSDTILNYFLYMILVVAATIAMAYLSNRYIESFFLKRKSNFAKIKSTN